MRLCIIAHSAIHARQQAFYRTLARRADLEVLVLAPEAWGAQRTAESRADNYRLVPLKALNAGAMEHFTLPGKKIVENFKPDWIYVQNEPWHAISLQAQGWAEHLGCKLALFSWENNRMALFEPARRVLQALNLLVVGSTETRMLLKDFTQALIHTDIQVGVEPEWFPRVPFTEPRLWDVLCLSRLDDPMKGAQVLPALHEALGQAYSFCVPHRSARLPYEAMHSFYKRSKVLLTPSIDLPWRPREQGPAYTNLEAMFSGTPVVTTTTASIDEWLPSTAVTKVPLEALQDADSPEILDAGVLAPYIAGLLGADPEGVERRALEAHRYASQRFSNSAIALRLLRAMEEAT